MSPVRRLYCNGIGVLILDVRDLQSFGDALKVNLLLLEVIKVLIFPRFGNISYNKLSFIFFFFILLFKSVISGWDVTKTTCLLMGCLVKNTLAKILLREKRLDRKKSTPKVTFGVVFIVS